MINLSRIYSRLSYTKIHQIIEIMKTAFKEAERSLYLSNSIEEILIVIATWSKDLGHGDKNKLWDQAEKRIRSIIYLENR